MAYHVIFLRFILRVSYHSCGALKVVAELLYAEFRFVFVILYMCKLFNLLQM
jgi:hypothetical protein